MISMSVSVLFSVVPEKTLGHSVASVLVVPEGVVSGGAVDVTIGCVVTRVSPSSDISLAVALEKDLLVDDD